MSKRKSLKVHVRVSTEIMLKLADAYIEETGMSLDEANRSSLIRWAVGKVIAETNQKRRGKAFHEEALQFVGLAPGEASHWETLPSYGKHTKEGMIPTLIGLLSEKLSASARYAPNGIDLLRAVEAILEDKADSFAGKSDLMEYIRFKIADEPENISNLWRGIEKIAEEELKAPLEEKNLI